MIKIRIEIKEAQVCFYPKEFSDTKAMKFREDTVGIPYVIGAKYELLEDCGPDKEFRKGDIIEITGPTGQVVRVRDKKMAIIGYRQYLRVKEVK